MRITAIALLACFVCAAAAHAQNVKRPKTITLSGCVQHDDAKPEEFRLTDAKASKTYRLTGVDLREYIGRPVQIDGGVVVKNLKISGGLQPNANIAAQAGALDPSRAAVQAATAGSTTGTPTDIEEFRVKTVRSASGECQ
jgi:hypothetical protein